jgi:hypothetical protein
MRISIGIRTGYCQRKSRAQTEVRIKWQKEWPPGAPAPPGKTLRNKIAAILHSCQRDAGAPSGLLYF